MEINESKSIILLIDQPPQPNLFSASLADPLVALHPHPSRTPAQHIPLADSPPLSVATLPPFHPAASHPAMPPATSKDDKAGGAASGAPASPAPAPTDALAAATAARREREKKEREDKEKEGMSEEDRKLKESLELLVTVITEAPEKGKEVGRHTRSAALSLSVRSARAWQLFAFAHARTLHLDGAACVQLCVCDYALHRDRWIDGSAWRLRRAGIWLCV